MKYCVVVDGTLANLDDLDVYMLTDENIVEILCEVSPQNMEHAADVFNTINRERDLKRMLRGG